MNKYRRHIFCLEGDWESDLRINSSIKPALQLLDQNAAIQSIYRSCGSFEELEVRLHQLSKASKRYSDYEIIYLAFHGISNEIEISGKSMSLDELASIAKNKLQNKIVHFGSCKTLDTDITTLNNFIEVTGARAISGFTKNVDFISSTVVDILYFELCQAFDRPKTIYKHMIENYGTICGKLKFTMHWPDKKN